VCSPREGLERESGRNVELMWLLGRLAPDFKTIADFRKDNTKAIKRVCREFFWSAVSWIYSPIHWLPSTAVSSRRSIIEIVILPRQRSNIANILLNLKPPCGWGKIGPWIMLAE
jgi:hypothetical protein